MASSKAVPPGSLRLPAPYLFVGPEERERAGSPGLKDGPSSTRIPLQRHRSDFARSQAGDINHAKADGEPAENSQLHDSKPLKQQQQSDDRTEAIWVEMQNTLEEVELTATNGLNNVFGPEHSRALQDLRAAQIRLAEAWGRSEADEQAFAAESSVKVPGRENEPRGDAVGQEGGLLAEDRKGNLGIDHSQGADGHTRNKSSGSAQYTKTQLEEDTDNDILLARQRREINDRYFERVNKGVLDVVAKLDDVASRMKAVENESKEIWNDVDSLESDSC